MKPEDVIKIIDEIPKYICYIYPGYISMYLYYYFKALTLDDTTGKLLKSIAISYIYVVFVQGCFNLINRLPNVNINTDAKSASFNITLLIVAVFVPCIVNKVQKCQKLRKPIKQIKKWLNIETTSARNEIEVLQAKYNDTIWIYIYMKDSPIMYEGSLTEKEMEDCKTKFFCLSKYRKYLIRDNGSKQILADYSDDEKEKVVIYFDRISHFEVANVDKQ